MPRLQLLASALIIVSHFNCELHAFCLTQESWRHPWLCAASLPRSSRTTHQGEGSHQRCSCCPCLHLWGKGDHLTIAPVSSSGWTCMSVLSLNCSPWCMCISYQEWIIMTLWSKIRGYRTFLHTVFFFSLVPRFHLAFQCVQHCGAWGLG